MGARRTWRAATSKQAVSTKSSESTEAGGSVSGGRATTGARFRSDVPLSIHQLCPCDKPSRESGDGKRDRHHQTTSSRPCLSSLTSPRCQTVSGPLESGGSGGSGDTGGSKDSKPQL